MAVKVAGWSSAPVLLILTSRRNAAETLADLYSFEWFLAGKMKCNVVGAPCSTAMLSARVHLVALTLEYKSRTSMRIRT